MLIVQTIIKLLSNDKNKLVGIAKLAFPIKYEPKFVLIIALIPKITTTISNI